MQDSVQSVKSAADLCFDPELHRDSYDENRGERHGSRLHMQDSPAIPGVKKPAFTRSVIFCPFLEARQHSLPQLDRGWTGGDVNIHDTRTVCGHVRIFALGGAHCENPEKTRQAGPPLPRLRQACRASLCDISIFQAA